MVQFQKKKKKCYNSNNIFFTGFLSQMTSCAMHYDIIYHPFPINSQYLKTWGLTALK